MGHEQEINFCSFVPLGFEPPQLRFRGCVLLQHIPTFFDCLTNSPNQNPKSGSHWLDWVVSPITEPITEGRGQECSDWLRPGSHAHLQV